MGRKRPSMNVHEVLSNGTEFTVRVDAPKSPRERRADRHCRHTDTETVYPIVATVSTRDSESSMPSFSAEELRHFARVLQRAAHHVEMLQALRCNECGEFEARDCYCEKVEEE